MNPFKKIGSAIVLGGKFAWRGYNRPEGKVLMSMFVPLAPLAAITAGVEATKSLVEHISENRKKDKAKELILAEFPSAANDKKMLNFLIEAKLQQIEGNLDID